MQCIGWATWGIELAEAVNSSFWAIKASIATTIRLSRAVTPTGINLVAGNTTAMHKMVQTTIIL